MRLDCQVVNHVVAKTCSQLTVLTDQFRAYLIMSNQSRWMFERMHGVPQSARKQQRDCPVHCTLNLQWPLLMCIQILLGFLPQRSLCDYLHGRAD